MSPIQPPPTSRNQPPGRFGIFGIDVRRGHVAANKDLAPTPSKPASKNGNLHAAEIGPRCSLIVDLELDRPAAAFALLGDQCCFSLHSQMLGGWIVNGDEEVEHL